MWLTWVKCALSPHKASENAPRGPIQTIFTPDISSNFTKATNLRNK